MFKKINRENKKGFTLAELLIVVAIIGVLVAVSIPIFTSQLEKSREAVDAANLRDAYALIATDALTPDENIATHDTKNIKFTKGSSTAGKYTPASAVVTATQQQANWQSGAQDIGGFNLAEADGGPGTWKVTVNGETGAATITFTAATS